MESHLQNPKGLCSPEVVPAARGSSRGQNGARGETLQEVLRENKIFVLFLGKKKGPFPMHIVAGLQYGDLNEEYPDSASF